MADSFLPAFRACITEAKGASVMCSYNAVSKPTASPSFRLCTPLQVCLKSSCALQVNGIPSCGNKWLLQDILRDEWGHEGHVVSDCGGVSDIENPRYPKTRACLAAQGVKLPSKMEETAAECWCNATDCGGFPTVGPQATAAAGITSGTDLDCGSVYKDSMASALESGAVSQVELDRSLQRLFLNRMRTGEFE